MIKKIILTIATVSSLFLMAAVLAPVDAGESCGAYGDNCPKESNLVIDKFIRDPRTKGEVYVDNLTYDDYRFSPGEDIIFKLVVQNVGDTTIHNAKIKDTLPDVASFIMLSGETSAHMREITKDWGSVGPNEVREWYFRVRVKPADQIGDNIVCGSPAAINHAVVRGDNVSDSYDSSSFCVEKTVLGITTHPATGSGLALIASGLVAVAGAGLAGKKLLK